HKTGINTKDDIIFRNQPKESQTQPTTPPERAGTISHATGTKNLALTNKHTVEFSNNRHTPTQHHPTGQNLAWGNFSNLPDPRCPFQLGDPSGKGRGTSSLHGPARRAKLRAVPRRGPPGGPATVSCDRDPCPFLPAGRTSRTLHAVRGRAKSVPRPTARRDAAHGCKGRAKGPGRST